jgi:hypothetical protein
MENGNMDPATWTQLILGALLAGGGLTGLINAAVAWRQKKAGVPHTETEARAEVDDKSFAAYLRAEIRRVRIAGERRVDNVQGKLDAAEEHIDDLTEHIWKQLPPPPPVRRHHPTEGDKDHG